MDGVLDKSPMDSMVYAETGSPGSLEIGVNPCVSVDISRCDLFLGWVKTGCEKKFAAKLSSENIQHFLPLVLRTEIRFGRKVKRLIPLFPTYVFFLGGNEERYFAVKTALTLEAPKAVKFKERVFAEITSIEKVTRLDPTVGIFRGHHTGQKCRVLHGAYRGVVGFIEKLDPKRPTKIVLGVSGMHTWISFETDAENLEVID